MIEIQKTKAVDSSMIVRELYNQFIQSSWYCLHNTFLFEWESDFVKIAAQSEYISEIEIKISLSDLKRDESKRRKYEILQHGKYIHSHKTWVRFDKETNKSIYTERTEEKRVTFRPHKFYFAVPSTIAERALLLIPEYAGLYSITFNDSGKCVGFSKIKEAKFLHKEPIEYHKRFLKSLYNKNLSFGMWSIVDKQQPKDEEE